MDLKEMLEDALDPVVRNPIIVKAVCLVLSLINLLCISAGEATFGVGISLFIGIFSLAVSCIIIGVVASDLQLTISNIKFFKYLKPNGEFKWSDIQYTYGLILASFNFIGILMNAALATNIHGRPYGVAAFFSCFLFLAFIIEALIALYEENVEDSERESLRPSNYSEV
uniref:MARVEL domain-containing protein n=1 Tax=Acrobeloides nanus TaxID=290746 RepID=A0A914C8G3_9BILA